MRCAVGCPPFSGLCVKIFLLLPKRFCAPPSSVTQLHIKGSVTPRTGFLNKTLSTYQGDIHVNEMHLGSVMSLKCRFSLLIFLT
ncbi:caspase 7, isoform CRA_b [Rattus norvegicus]|uniref:Caspase 7, isoform CRA_b n=1 Tax=Rattus norvegicus TaxID=10116 RepID=A6JI21_RAT|nr:caspase 7, isoform CRA_b [Rattus norvegicus]